MVWLDFIIAAILAGILASIVVSVAARRRDVVWPGFWFYFVILTLGIWAVRLWLEPTLWPGYGWQWLAMAAIGVIIALAMLVAVVPKRPGRGAVTSAPVADPLVPEADRVMDAESASTTSEVVQYSYGLMFWLLVIALIGAVAAGLTFAPSATP